MDKYKEAIERLKQWDKEHPNGGYSIQERDEFIFPELAEPEDESIRKALLEMVHDTTGDSLWVDYGVHKEDAIAWLEIQGEHANFLNNIQIGDKVTRNEDGVLVNLSQLNRVAKSADKQDEQKDILEDTVLDSNEDGLIADTIQSKPKFKVGDKIYLKPEYRMPKDDTPIANTVFEIRRIDDKYYRFDRSYIFIEDQDKYELVEQNPAWSEEDETITSALSQLLKDCELENSWNCVYSNDKEVFFVDIENWLKTFKERVQPNPKQEWSEGDKVMLDEIIDFFENGTVKLQHDLSLYASWLKSLRPQNTWKPSEEQIVALKHASNDCSIAFADMKILATLYEQLKALHHYEQDT